MGRKEDEGCGEAANPFLQVGFSIRVPDVQKESYLDFH